MVQRDASGEMKKTPRNFHKRGRVGGICEKKEIAGNGQMQGYRWLHRRVIKMMYVASQDNMTADQVVSLTHLHKGIL